MVTTKTIKLDVTKTYVEPINLVQYEKDARVLDIQLTAGSLPVNLTGANVVFYAKKPDNTIVFNACTVIDAVNGKIQYTVTEQTCVIAGDLRCWVLITSTGASLRSLEFTITVQPSEDDTSAVESKSEFTALETALSTVSAYDGRIAQNETDIDGLDTRLTTAEGDIVDVNAAIDALIDIEQGVWTPTLKATSTNPAITYTTNQGAYTVIGDQVTAMFQISCSGVNGGSGDVYIGGLPYSPALDRLTRCYAALTVANTVGGITVVTAGAYFNGTNFMLTYDSTADRILASNLGANFYVFGTLHYYK